MFWSLLNRNIHTNLLIKKIRLKERKRKPFQWYNALGKQFQQDDWKVTQASSSFEEKVTVISGLLRVFAGFFNRLGYKSL